MLKFAPHMADTKKTEAAEERISRVYEAGYLIVPTVKEDEVDGVVNAIRSEVEKVGGSFIAEGAPALMKLAYTMEKREGEKYAQFDRAYFGWLKFEAGTDAAQTLTESLQGNTSILRSIVFKTVREDTRAKIKAPLREVKRTDTIKKKTDEPTEAAPVSEADLEKALETLTQD